jgi:rare lipoprotein A
VKLKNSLIITVLLVGQLLGMKIPAQGANCGVASWYGPHGGKTASGERFNRWGYTAASPWRRLGSRIRVINPHNRRRVLVRINDRLPPGHADLDLSYAAFRQIASPRKGLVKVCVIRLSR